VNRKLVIGLSFVLQIALTLTPILPYTKSIWSSQRDATGYVSLAFTLLGIYIIIFTATILIALQDPLSSLEKRYKEVLDAYTPLQVKTLKEGAFYRDFLSAIISAEDYVHICYFSPRPPTLAPTEERHDYDKALIGLIRKRPHIEFKRLIRDSPENRVWTREQASKLRNRTNVQIALLKDLNETEEMPLALSVQIVDHKSAWLVAIGEHSNAPTYRDIFISNADVVSMLSKYYERLWSKARVVVKPGMSLEEIDAALGA
jgi:hypothetical protein